MEQQPDRGLSRNERLTFLAGLGGEGRKFLRRKNMQSLLLTALLCCGFLITVSVAARAEDFYSGFEEGAVISRAHYNPKLVQLKLHERNAGLAYAGQGAERFQFVSSDYNVAVTIEYEIPPARVLDELKISLAASSNRPGAQLAARVVFPYQLDPQTGRPLTRMINGATLEKVSSWQELSCRTADELLARHLILWRASLKPQELDPRGMYIDRVVLQLNLGRGMTEVLVDELRVSPIVKPSNDLLQTPDEQRENTVSMPKIDFQLDQLQADGLPVFPVIVPYQRESVELFSQLGANVVWVDDYANRELVDQLNSRGIWATAWPPSAKSSQGQILDAQQANLIPFDRETNGILFWNLGVRIEPENHKQLQHWVNQVKSSDRVHNRPVLADVTASETIFSRDVDMLGISKHILQSPYGFRDYADHLQHRKQLAQPGTFVMSWIQTEPSRAVTQYREGAGLSPAVIEPEQIRLQTYAALNAGCRGLGFWNWTPLNANGPGYDERRLVLEQLCLELKLLEPFLASGEVIHRFEIPLTPTLADNSGPVRKNQSQAATKSSSDPAPLAAAVAVVRSEHGLIILLNALEENAQFVPGPMGQSDVQVLIRGLPESAFLREITTTGLWPLETRRVTGGTEIRLPRFNMTAALVVATDQGVAQKMEARIQSIQTRSAELSLQLAEAKYARVLTVDQQMISAGVGLPEATHIMEQARRTLDSAREAMVKQQYHQARLNADLSCQLLRILQRLYWQQAVQYVSAPTSMPHTLCFQTLPDHWKLIQQLGQAETERSELIRSGRFEDPEAMRVEGWTKDVSSSKQIIVYDALDPQTAREGEYCLRMAAVPAMGEEHVTLQSPAVTYRSPAISVKPGDLLHVSGWVRIPRPILNSLEGFRIYDTQYGVASCLKWLKPTGDWQQFELVRPIWKQEDLHLLLELNGLGDVAVDDLQVKIVRLKSPGSLNQASLEEEVEAPENPKARSNAFDFLNRFMK